MAYETFPSPPDTDASRLNLVRANFVNTFKVAGLMVETLPGVDVVFDQMTRTPWHRWWSRYVNLPLSLHLAGEGWVILEQAAIAAYLYLGYGRTSCHINNIGVAPQHQRQGIARALLDFAEAQTHRRRLEALTLAVTVQNTPAVTLYTSTGYQPMHHHFWQGSGRDLTTLGGSPLRLYELFDDQVEPVFEDFWATALEADTIPTHPMLTDQQRYWRYASSVAFAVRGPAPEPVGFLEVDLSIPDARIRLLSARPDDPTLLAHLCAAGATLLQPWQRVELDLGSHTADHTATPLLTAQGLRHCAHPRMLMIKAL